MAIEKLSDGQAHKRLKRLMQEMWARVKAKFADVCVALAEMARRIEESVRIQNLLWLLESRNRNDLIACAYNSVRFV